MHRPLISIIRCHNPNEKGSRNRNRNMFMYIGTREGVDLSPSSDDGISRLQSPKAHGLFGNIDLENIKETASELYRFTARGKPIYHGTISLSELDAQELGYTDKAKWETYMHRVMPEIASIFHIPIDKFAWAAAVHMETGHPHCQYMFWRTDEAVKSSFISVPTQNKCREMLSGQMFEEEKVNHIIDKTAARNLITDYSKIVFEEIGDEIIHYASLPGRLHEADLCELSKKLCSLLQNLPVKGSLDYAYMPKNIKEQIDDISNTFFAQKDIKKYVHAYREAVSDLSKTYSPSSRHHEVNLGKGKDDLYTRVGNIILNAVDNLKKSVEVSELPSPELPLSPDAFPLHGENVFDIEAAEKDFTYDLRSVNASLKWSDSFKEASRLFYEKRDYEKALEMLQPDIGNDNVLAFELCGKIYAVTNQPELSAHFYQKALAGFHVLLFSQKDRKDYLSYKLGKYYEHGLGTEPDYDKAIRYYAAAAGNGNQYAQYALGSMYLHEKGISFTAENRDDYMKEIARLYKASADQGFCYAEYAYARLCETEGIGETDYQEYYTCALHSFERQLQENPNDYLSYRLGTMYYDGKGTRPDPEKGIDYFYQSAKFKNGNALYALGKIYSDKNMRTYAPQKAEAFFLQAIEQKNSYAECALGELYLDIGSPLFSLNKGISILEQLAADGNSGALFALGRFYTQKDNPYQDFNTGEKYLLKAIESGNATAQCRLGNLYLTDHLHYSSTQNGIDLLTPLAESGNMTAQYHLGKFYADHNTAYYNAVLAEKFLCAATVRDNEFARYSLAKLYLDREGTLYHPQLAISYLEPAAQSGNAFAQAQLGSLYLWGNHDGVEKDLKTAKYWLNQAIAQDNEFAKEALNFYENMVNSNIMTQCAYTLFRDIYNSISSETLQKKQFLEELKKFASHSRENQKSESHRHEV